MKLFSEFILCHFSRSLLYKCLGAPALSPQPGRWRVGLTAGNVDIKTHKNADIKILLDMGRLITKIQINFSRSHLVSKLITKVKKCKLFPVTLFAFLHLYSMKYNQVLKDKFVNQNPNVLADFRRWEGIPSSKSQL